MRTLKDAFNLRLLNVDNNLVRNLRPVTSVNIYDGTSTSFDIDGLYSDITFGKQGTEDRSHIFSYIDLKIPIMHPKYFLELVKLKKFYGDIILGLAYATWDEAEKEFVPSNVLEGETGFYFFKKHYKDIVFKRNSSVKRDSRIELLTKYKDIAYSRYVLVIPAGYRDVEVDRDGRTTTPDINKLYMSLLNSSITLGNVVDPDENSKYYNVTAVSMQRRFVELYKHIVTFYKGKHSAMMQKWASTNVTGGTRNVLVSPSSITYDLDSKSAHSIHDTQIGLFQYAKAFLPHVVYAVVNGFASSIVQVGQTHADLVNPKTWKSEYVKVNDKMTELLTNEEGVEKLINYYSYRGNRQLPVIIGNHYLALVYQDGKYMKIMRSIDELPKHLDRSNVHPMTYTELFYISICDRNRREMCTTTRYPISGEGSMYEAFVYLRTTSVTQELMQLGDDFMPNQDAKIYPCYPLPDRNQSHYDAMSANQMMLKSLGGDHDGDSSLTFNL